MIQQILKILEEDKPQYLAVASDQANQHSDTRNSRPTRLPAKKCQKIWLSNCLIYRDSLKPYITLPDPPGYEADDIIGTLMNWCSNADLEGVMVTSDKDYMQLITDKITLLNHNGDRVGKAGFSKNLGARQSKSSKY